MLNLRGCVAGNKVLLLVLCSSFDLKHNIHTKTLWEIVTFIKCMLGGARVQIIFIEELSSLTTQLIWRMTQTAMT